MEKSQAASLNSVLPTQTIFGSKNKRCEWKVYLYVMWTYFDASDNALCSALPNPLYSECPLLETTVQSDTLRWSWFSSELLPVHCRCSSVMNCGLDDPDTFPGKGTVQTCSRPTQHPLQCGYRWCLSSWIKWLECEADHLRLVPRLKDSVDVYTRIKQVPVMYLAWEVACCTTSRPKNVVLVLIWCKLYW
jgi:hypothetical protein